MDLTIAYYLIYLSLSAYLIFKVGHQLYSKGQVYLDLLLAEQQQAKALNRLLLMGYYLVNLGYVAYRLSLNSSLSNSLELMEKLTENLGLIAMLLGALHINNLIVLFLISKSKFNQKSI